MSPQAKTAITSAEPGRTLSLGLRALGHDPKPRTNAKGEPIWRACSCDPKLTAKLPASQVLRPGWYSVSVTLEAHRGCLAEPRLYIPNEDGMLSEARSVVLRPAGSAHVAQFYLPYASQELRFDPSIYPCEFSCAALHLTPIAGPSSWRTIVHGLLRSRLPSTKLIAQWCRAGMRILGSHGPRGLARAIYERSMTRPVSNRRTYLDWIAAYAEPDGAQRQAMSDAARDFSRQPLISVVTPVYNTPEEYLRAAIESILGQVYARWELCLADDASTAPHVRRVLEEYRSRDARIKVVYRRQNGHISAATNSALELAVGEFVALLDHDDTLAPDALFWVAKELNDFPTAALMYSDEDKLDPDGVPTTPYFKCDWNYDLFLSHNLIAHGDVYRTDLVRELGGFRSAFDGAQDYDLTLRFIEQIDASQIRHIPRVLYHWRMAPGSTAIGPGQKDYAAERARLAVEEHLARRHVPASVETIPGMAVQRVRYQLPARVPRISIVISTRNAKTLVQRCLDSIRQRTTYGPYEILLVDNGSDDEESLDYFATLSDAGRVRLLRDPGPFNFSRINNDAVRHAAGEYLVFLNNDIEVIASDWLTELVSHAQRPGVGAVGARLWYPDDTIQHAGLVLVAGLAGHAHSRRARGDHGYFSRASLVQAYCAVTGACLCIRKRLFEEAGGFDEALAVAFNDVDFCLRLHAMGYRNLYTPYAELYHHESATRGYEDTPEKVARLEREAQILQERWMELLANDPYYNPNLALTGEPFTLAWPPRVQGFPSKAIPD